VNDVLFTCVGCFVSMTFMVIVGLIEIKSGEAVTVWDGLMCVVGDGLDEKEFDGDGDGVGWIELYGLIAGAGVLKLNRGDSEAIV
jgi:hypothetical protein